MKAKFWFIGFLLWVLFDYFVVKLIIPSFVMTEDKGAWLNIWLLTFNFAPLWVIGVIIISAIQVFVFGYIISMIWDKIGYRFKRRGTSYL